MKGLIFTYTMTYGGAVLALFRPFAGFLIFLSFSILKPDALWVYAVPAGNYSRIVFISVLIGWMLSGCGNWRLGRARGIVIALGVYLVFLALSAFGAANQTHAWNIVWEIFKTIGTVVVGLSLIDSARQVKQMTWVILISMAYLAYEFNFSYYLGNNWLVRAGFASMDDKSVSTTLVVGAGMAFFAAMSVQRFWLKLLVLGLAALMMHVPLFAHHRGGMLGLVATAIMVFILLPKRPIYLAIFACVLLLGFRLAGSDVRHQFSSIFVDAEARDDSADSRFVLWGQAWETTMEHPFFGIGLRQWQRWSVTQYGWKSGKEVHNTWFQLGAEIGLLGLTAFACFFVVPAVKLWRMRNRFSGGSFESLYCRMCIVALAGFAVTSQFITIYGLEAPYFVVMIAGGLLKVTPQPTTVPAAAAVPTGMRVPPRSVHGQIA